MKVTIQVHATNSNKRYNNFVKKKNALHTGQKVRNTKYMKIGLGGLVFKNIKINKKDMTCLEKYKKNDHKSIEIESKTLLSFN